MTANGLPTGTGTSTKNDVADPHPSAEEDYDKIPRPGGAKPPNKAEPGPNDYAHDGSSPPRRDDEKNGTNDTR